MYRSIKTAIACMAAIITLCSCDNQDKAENLIKDFLDKNLQTSEYSVSFTELDSTRHVTDSAINAMRANAANNKQYIFIRTKMSIGKDTINQTFYLDPELTSIVSFKEN
jgi:uncharacterized lipoprotein NlpE involved in copper resistance